MTQGFSVLKRTPLGRVERIQTRQQSTQQQRLLRDCRDVGCKLEDGVTPYHAGLLDAQL